MTGKSQGRWALVIAFLGLIALMVALGAPAVGAPKAAAPGKSQDDATLDARDQFDDVFGDKFKRAQAAPQSDEALALAQTLLDTAKAPGTGVNKTLTVPMVKILCEAAFDLAAHHPKGLPLALVAAETLLKKDPHQRAALVIKMLPYLQDCFDNPGAGTPGADRTAAGSALLDWQTSAADAKLSHDPALAATLYQQSLETAAIVRPEAQASLKLKLAAATAKATTLKQIDALKDQVESNPGDVAAREKLIAAYVVDLDDPAAAEALLTPVVKEDWRKYVPLAARGGHGASPEKTLELGDWYKDLGNQAADATAQAKMFTHASAYYQRFLSLHTPNDLLAAKVKAALAGISQAKARLSEPGATPSEPGATPGASATGHVGGPSATGHTPAPAPLSAEPCTAPKADVLKEVRLDKDAVRGNWSKAGDDIVVKPFSIAHLAIPVAPQGDYNLEVNFTRADGKEEVAVILPVGPNSVALLVDGAHGTSTRLANISNVKGKMSASVPGTFVVNGKAQTLAVHVRVKDDQARIEAEIDGKPLISWQGAVKPLEVFRQWKDGVADGALAIGASGSNVAFHSVLLQMVTGTPKSLK